MEGGKTRQPGDDADAGEDGFSDGDEGGGMSSESGKAEGSEGNVGKGIVVKVRTVGMSDAGDREGPENGEVIGGGSDCGECGDTDIKDKVNEEGGEGLGGSVPVAQVDAEASIKIAASGGRPTTVSGHGPRSTRASLLREMRGGGLLWTAGRGRQGECVGAWEVGRHVISTASGEQGGGRGDGSRQRDKILSESKDGHGHAEGARDEKMEEEWGMTRACDWMYGQYAGEGGRVWWNAFRDCCSGLGMIRREEPRSRGVSVQQLQVVYRAFDGSASAGLGRDEFEGCLRAAADRVLSMEVKERRRGEGVGKGMGNFSRRDGDDMALIIAGFETFSRCTCGVFQFSHNLYLERTAVKLNLILPGKHSLCDL